MIWPPDYDAEYLRRYKLFFRARDDAAMRKELMAFYKYNPIEWIGDCCITFDPRIGRDKITGKQLSRIMPFLLFDRQKEFVTFLQECNDEGENGLTEKSRDMGGSWISCAFSCWLWLFWPGSAIGFGSRKEELVDKKGDPKALFPKIRQIMDYLPTWMMPEDWNPIAHSTHMKIINPNNDSSIVGEAGENMGRGGRTTIYFKDEAAHYEHPELIEAALGDNTNVQIDISSVHGTANVFYNRRMAGELWTPGHKIEPGVTRVFILDWRDHPGKTQEWYDRRRTKAESEGLLHLFAQEVDRDYSSSVQGILIPQLWVKAAIDAHVKLGWEPQGSIRAMQDVADGGGDKNALVIMHGNVYVYADHWTGEAGEAAKLAVPICNEKSVSELYWDSVGVGTGFRVQINTMRDAPSWNRHLKVFPWNGGGAPLDPDGPSIPGDYQSPLNKDQYKNLKAQSWFRTRSKFYKTYKAVTAGEKYPFEELISIDSGIKHLHELCRELSQPVRKMNEEGKTIVDKKPKGSFSPNLADAAIGVDNPCAGISILDVL